MTAFEREPVDLANCHPHVPRPQGITFFLQLLKPTVIDMIAKDLAYERAQLTGNLSSPRIIQSQLTLDSKQELLALAEFKPAHPNADTRCKHDIVLHRRSLSHANSTRQTSRSVGPRSKPTQQARRGAGLPAR